MRLYIYIIMFFIALTFNNSFAKDNEISVFLDLDKEIREGSKFEFVIYYMPLDVLTSVPVTIDCIKVTYSYKIIIDSGMIARYIEQKLEKINSIKLQKSNIDDKHIRVHCEILGNNKKPIFSFSLGGSVMYVNGIKVKPNKYYYKLIQDFMPVCELEGYKKFMQHIK